MFFLKLRFCKAKDADGTSMTSPCSTLIGLDEPSFEIMVIVRAAVKPIHKLHFRSQCNASWQRFQDPAAKLFKHKLGQRTNITTPVVLQKYYRRCLSCSPHLKNSSDWFKFYQNIWYRDVSSQIPTLFRFFEVPTEARDAIA